MIEIGDEFDVKGNIGIVCFKGHYYDQDYICIAFEEEKKFGIYKVKYDNDKFFVAEETDKEKCSYVLAEFVTDEVFENTEKTKLTNLLINNNIEEKNNNE